MREERVKRHMLEAKIESKDEEVARVQENYKNQSEALGVYQRRAAQARKDLEEEEELREELFDEKLTLEKRVSDLMQEIQRMEEERILGNHSQQASDVPVIKRDKKKSRHRAQPSCDSIAMSGLGLGAHLFDY